MLIILNYHNACRFNPRRTKNVDIKPESNAYLYLLHDPMSRVPGGGDEYWNWYRQWKWYRHRVRAAVHVHWGWHVDWHRHRNQHFLAHGIFCK